MSVSENSFLSFWDYKINYNHCLGVGSVGTVYGVVKRPANEKGYLPYLMPYLYDYVFPLSEVKENDRTNLCVKISNTILNLIESFEEVQANTLMQKYKLTTVKFYKTASLYSQFKTMVNGHTFQYYLVEGHFSTHTQYPLRQAFVSFLESAVASKIDFGDLHRENIMFDESAHRWEVVDGYVTEFHPSTSFDKKQYLKHIFCDLGLYSVPVVRKIFKKIFKVVREGHSYNEEMDQKLLRKVSLLQ